MKQKHLSSLEQEIMNLVWEHKQCSVRDVLVDINKKRTIAYTTVATILQRLEDKGLVSKKTSEKTHIYSPKISKQSYGKRLANSFMQMFVKSFGNVAISSFAESIDELPKEKREYFLKLLEKHDKSK